MSGSEGVVLLHGILLTRRSMALVARHLRRSGFQVLNITYPSRSAPIGDLAYDLHSAVADFARQVDRLHFVGFSMGGLLIRAYLARHRPANLGRVVMLGTPNHGSEVADFLKGWRVFRWLYGPAGLQLVTDQRSILPILGQVDYELGIIAGETRARPLSDRLFRQPHDGAVSVESTKLAGMLAHVIHPRSHTLLPFTPAVWRHIAYFLRHGRFSD